MAGNGKPSRKIQRKYSVGDGEALGILRHVSFFAHHMFECQLHGISACNIRVQYIPRPGVTGLDVGDFHMKVRLKRARRRKGVGTRAWGWPIAWLGNRLTDSASGKEKSRHLTCAVLPPGFWGFLCVGYVCFCLFYWAYVCREERRKKTHGRVTVSWLCRLDM